MNVAIIPARGGSKRIPRKNIKDFCGKPMIQWSIEAALESGCFDRVIVSTDDVEIAEIARARGAEAPFLRPAELSNDYAGTMSVIQHALAWLITERQHYDYACCLYATAPFIQPQDIQQSFKLIKKTGSEYAMTITSYPFPIQRALRVKACNTLEMLEPQQFNTRSQDLEEAYHDAGQFYWGKTTAWLDGKAIFNANTIPLVLPRYRVQDIDTLEDWERAEWLFKAMKK